MAKAVDNEKVLLLQLINGDEQAFCELYAAYRNRLLYFVWQFVKSKEQAEDIFHDTFVAVWHNRRFINPDAIFSSFLYTIARNRVLNHLRDLSYYHRFQEQFEPLALDYADETFQQVQLHELEEMLQSALNQLSPRQKEVFELSRRDGLSHKEIAKRLNISINTVQDYISSSIRHIRAYFIDNDLYVLIFPFFLSDVTGGFLDSLIPGSL